jgi:hypothetical protein
MYTIVYINTSALVFTSRKLYSLLKHRCHALLRSFIALKNRRLHRVLRAFVYCFRLRIKPAIPPQPPVYQELLRGGL